VKVERPGVQGPGRSEMGFELHYGEGVTPVPGCDPREGWLDPPLSFVYRLTADWQQHPIGGFLVVAMARRPYRFHRTNRPCRRSSVGVGTRPDGAAPGAHLGVIKAR